MNPVMFKIGSFEIRWYSVLILIGAILGYLIAKREAKKFNINEDFVFNMFFWTLIFGIIGARIYYVVFNWNLYAADPLSAFKFWEGGLAIHGGIIAGLMTMAIYCKRYNANLIKMTDIVVPSLFLAQAIGRWGNFFNQEAYGNIISLQALKNMHLPKFIIDGMYISGSYREPTFLYESICSLIGFILLLILRATKKLKTGQLTAIYLIWYGIVRFGIETLRSDSLMLGQIKVAQLVSLLFVISGIALFIYSYIKKKKYCLDKIVTN